jgi:transposase-like protein
MTASSPSSPRRSPFAGFRHPRDVIALAVRWYLRYGLSYRDLEELLFERGIAVDHVTIHRWVQRFTPLFIDAARDRRQAVGRRWHVDESYVRVAGVWHYLYRAIDEHGQVVDVLLSARRDAAAAREFFLTAKIRTSDQPAEVITDRAPAYVKVVRDLVPEAIHTRRRYANNPVECDHGRFKARWRPMRGMKRAAAVSVVARGHAFIQNLRRGHYRLSADIPRLLRIPHMFSDLAWGL